MNKVFKIINSLIYFASLSPDKTINAMKAYKLIWLADRLHLRKYGRTITGDTYYALPKGIVPTDAKHIIDGKSLNTPEDIDTSPYLENIGKGKYKALREFESVYFSKTDIEALKEISQEFGKLSAAELSRLSHNYPEWMEYEIKIKDPERHNSYLVDMDLMFENTIQEPSSVFMQSEIQLKFAKETFHNIY